MATKIVTKNSSTASAVPTASDLVQGELAVNVADKRLFTEDNAGAIVELGTNPSGNVTFQDNGKAIFGAGDDLQIYHDGSNSYINDAGTGNLYLRASNAIIMQSADGAETIASFHDDNLCRLYFDNAIKLATTSTGIDVTGTATMDGLVVDGTSVLDSETNFVANSTASNKSLVLASSGATGGNGQYGASVAFSRINSESPRAAIAAVNTDSNYERMGLSFWTHPNNTADVMVKRMQIDHDGDISFYEDTGTTPKLFWDASAESLGIGTTTTTGTLNIQAGSPTIRFYDSNLVTRQMEINAENGNAIIKVDPNQTEGTSYYSVEIDAAERMRIDSSGNVGIGTSSPNAVTNYTGLTLNNATYGGFIDIENNGTHTFRLLSNTTASYIGTIESDPLVFSTADTERMRIDSSGNVSIGTSATSAPFRVNVGTDQNCAINTSGGNPRITAFNDAVTASVPLGFNGSILKFETGGDERMRIDSSGNLLVGTTSVQGAGGVTLSGAGYVYSSRPSSVAIYADRTGSDGAIQEFRKGGTTVGSISVTSSATSYNTSSDQRLKENIADADDAGSKIDAIQVRKYDWKADGSHQDYGMVAQELLEVAPEAVSVPEDSEEMMGVDYSKLVPMLIKEIQSLRNRVAQLEA